MPRRFIIIGMLAAAALAQNPAGPSPAKPSLDEQLANVSQLLERGTTSEAERLLRQLVPKPEEELVQDSGIFSSSGFHDVMWAMVGHSYFERPRLPRRGACGRRAAPCC